MAQTKKRTTRTHPAKKNSRPAPPKPATASDWIAGARIRTLGLSIGPIAVGYGAAVLAGEVHTIRTVLALIVALALQIGVNYANDYSDGVRGTDNVRVGPSRLVGSGKAKPRTVLIVALSFFALAALAGLGIVIITQYWWLLAVGAVALLAGWFYTGGKRPYGYYGLGELVAFLFFGPVATLGTTYINAGTINHWGLLGGIALGLFAAATLLINNVRDIDQDKLAGKRTFSVLVGRRASIVIFVVLMLLPYGIAVPLSLVFSGLVLIWLTLLIAIPVIIIAVTAKTPKELVLVLQLVGITSLAYGIIMGVAFAL